MLCFPTHIAKFCVGVAPECLMSKSDQFINLCVTEPEGGSGKRVGDVCAYTVVIPWGVTGKELHVTFRQPNITVEFITIGCIRKSKTTFFQWSLC